MALVIDWVSSILITVIALGPAGYAENKASSWITLGIFLVQTAVGVAVAGGSFGQLATRLRVLKTTGGTVSLLPAVLRSVLVCLVIPPLIFKPDGRGLHDLAVGSGVYRLPKS